MQHVIIIRRSHLAILPFVVFFVLSFLHLAGVGLPIAFAVEQSNQNKAEIDDPQLEIKRFIQRRELRAAIDVWWDALIRCLKTRDRFGDKIVSIERPPCMTRPRRRVC